MHYSDALVAEIRRIYQDFPELVAHAEAGHSILGRYLDDNTVNVDPEAILLCETIEQAKQLAQLALDKRRVYARWYMEYCEE